MYYVMILQGTVNNYGGIVGNSQGQVHTHILAYMHAWLRFLRVCMYVRRTYTCVYMHRYAYVCMHLHMCAYADKPDTNVHYTCGHISPLYKCMHTTMHVHMHVHVDLIWDTLLYICLCCFVCLCMCLGPPICMFINAFTHVHSRAPV